MGRALRVHIGLVLGIYWGYIWIMEKNMGNFYLGIVGFRHCRV